MMADFQPFPPDHYIGQYLAQASNDEAAGYICGRTYHTDPAPDCNCPHCGQGHLPGVPDYRRKAGGR